MTDAKPPPPESDADVVLFALKNMGSANYATLAVATGLSKPAISAAVTDLTKRGLVTGKSGTYSVTDSAKKPTKKPAKPKNAKTATTEDPPPPPPPPPAPGKKNKKQQPTGAVEPNADSGAVQAALKKMGSGNYAAIAEASGLSKMAVSSAITDLTKQGLVTGKGGEYTLSDGTTKKPTPKPKATPKTAAKKPAPRAKPAAGEAKKQTPTAKSGVADADDDADVVQAALKKMGSGNYAAIAEATGLSKIAVSSAITDLTKQGLVTGQRGEYTLSDGGAMKPARKPKAPQTKKPAQPAKTDAAPGTSLAEELERLTALRDSGALTAAEFTKAKKKLLDAN